MLFTIFQLKKVYLKVAINKISNFSISSLILIKHVITTKPNNQIEVFYFESIHENKMKMKI